MNLYLAGSNGKEQIIRGVQKKTIGLCQAANVEPVDIAELAENLGIKLEPLSEVNVLESFYYTRNSKSFPALIPYLRNFLLDSGAFTFLAGSKGAINWDSYVDEYAEYINKYNIKQFFELDIDSIVGLKEVERLRYKLESLTHKKPIPVWHKNRGKDYFVQMCKDYPYVALGGIVIKEIPIDKFEIIFPWFIATAHQYKRKIHGLGYTRQKGLHQFHFDSVDSAAWLYGNRGGYLYKFNPLTGYVDKIYSKEGKRFKTKETAIFNFNEWVKFSKYARFNL